MIQKIRETKNLVQNMGWKYLQFRVTHEVKRRTGMLKRKFPADPPFQSYCSLEKWKELKVSFFFKNKNSLKFKRNPSRSLEEWYKNYQEGKLLFFGSTIFNLGQKYDWMTHPETGFVFDHREHWTEIPDFSKEAGDIKYVWEKSRFSFLYNLIRYDYHFDHDCSELVFDEILSWIDHNPVNCGPNYRCSQEITLRVLNWTFALNYYKNSLVLNETIFQKILHHIYWQVKHVYDHIHFSRVAVRNNHAITETMGLYLFGMLFSFFPDAGKWKADGKKWFEKEVTYQVYPDGTFLQFSMNYHRVVVQLLTWGIRLAELNHEIPGKVVKERATASLNFLVSCMDRQSGFLPNYGANDGALFFPLNDRDIRDFRPQLHALSKVLNQETIEDNNEDQCWYGISKNNKSIAPEKKGIIEFTAGGYYLLREKDCFSFIRCGNHRDRPSQADNLHLDLWVNGNNILRDGGSYKYNVAGKINRYFFGTASHNTVMLGDFDQMKKGTRFIWYFWTQAIEAGWTEYEDFFEFKGAIQAFQHVSENIIHRRSVKKYKTSWNWEITDEIDHNSGLAIHQHWHPMPPPNKQMLITALDEKGNKLSMNKIKGWHSPKYGQKEESEVIVFSTTTKRIRTVIEVVDCN